MKQRQKNDYAAICFMLLIILSLIAVAQNFTIAFFFFDFLLSLSIYMTERIINDYTNTLLLNPRTKTTQKLN